MANRYPRPDVVKFSYAFLGVEYESPDITTLCRVDDARLAEELRDAPGDMAYWNAVVAYANARLRKSETDFDLFKAMKDKIIRAQLSSPDSKVKVTERVVESEMQSDTAYQEWVIAINNMKLEVDNVTVIANSLRSKLTALTTIAGLRRSEAEAHRAMSMPETAGD